MKKESFFIGVSLWALSLSAVYAHDGQVNVTGTITAASCNVEPDSKNQSVYIGEFSASSFAAVGDTSTPAKFDIKMNGCNNSIHGATIKFSGDADSNNSSLLALTGARAGGNVATGVAVEVLDANSNPLSINTVSSGLYALTTGENTLTFYLRYKSTLPTLTAGNAAAIMYFDLQYQ